MALTLLQMVNRAQALIGIAQSNAVIGATDLQTAQLLALSNQLGADLAREYDWQRLVKIYVFQGADQISLVGQTTISAFTIKGLSTTSNLSTAMVVAGNGIPAFAEITTIDSLTQVTLNMPATLTTASSSCSFQQQDYSLPSDYDRAISDTGWDRTDHWKNIGPKGSQEWQWLVGGLISTSPVYRWRIYQNKMRFFGSPTTAINFAYEYVSSNWVIATGADTASKTAFSVDTDTYIFKDDVMVLGLRYYWTRAQKLDFTTELIDFQRAMSTAKAQDIPEGAKSLSPDYALALLSPASVPDATWNIT